MTDPDIASSYLDDHGHEHHASEATVAALRKLIGRPEPELAGRWPLVVGPDWQPTSDGVVRLEDGTERAVSAGLAPNLPLGYHTLATGRAERGLVVAPARCRQPGARTWGIAVQLYAARSRASWGIGDLRDLATVHATAARHGAGFVLVNPLHAAAPVDEQESCPYAPVTRLHRSPLYLSVPDVPGCAATDLSDLALAATEANRSTWIDRDTVWRIKREALARIRRTGAGEAEFREWQADQPEELHRFATWCALSERFGASTATWPAGFAGWDAPQVAGFAAAERERVDFHAWLQWLLARQSAEFGGGVVHDLAVGVAPDGADTWIWPDAFVHGATIGAPPDALAGTGQDWGMVPLHPWRIRAAGYRPFARLLRATMTGSAGIRVDHVLGLFRLWCIPPGNDPTAGAYVRYPADDLLAVAALESHRAGVPIIGEDLGTVEEGVRERLAERGVLTCRVLMFEPETPNRWPVAALASANTHDVPTVSGLWTGADLADQRAAGVAMDAETARLRRRVQEVADVPADAAPAAVVDAVHRAVGAAPCVLAAVGLDDVLGVEHRPNIPGTDRPENWTRPLPVPVDDLDAALSAAAAALGRPAEPQAAGNALP